MPGPAPNPDARRRNLRPAGIVLPSEGYSGEVPEWPLSEWTMAEEAAWYYLWRLPQAAAWAQMKLERTVARYTRSLVLSEEPTAMTTLLSEVRQLEDRLGLTPMSMLRLQWTVAKDEVAEARAQSSRPRVSAIDPATVEEATG